MDPATEMLLVDGDGAAGAVVDPGDRRGRCLEHRSPLARVRHARPSRAARHGRLGEPPPAGQIAAADRDRQRSRGGLIDQPFVEIGEGGRGSDEARLTDRRMSDPDDRHGPGPDRPDDQDRRLAGPGVLDHPRRRVVSARAEDRQDSGHIRAIGSQAPAGAPLAPRPPDPAAQPGHASGGSTVGGTIDHEAGTPRHQCPRTRAILAA